MKQFNLHINGSLEEFELASRGTRVNTVAEAEAVSILIRKQISGKFELAWDPCGLAYGLGYGGIRINLFIDANTEESYFTR